MPMYNGQREQVIKGRQADPIRKTVGAGVTEELEKVYGKYFYVPFDIPVIKANDHERFVDWYFNNSATASKKKANIANSNGIYNNHFKTINAREADEVWTSHVVNVFSEFPELKDQLMEFFPLTDTGLWRMWSSTAKILNHRDDDSLVDCPMAMRVKLYDENPTETLWLREDEEPWNIIRLPDLKDTNSFAWNNVRTYHGSEYDPQYKKILWILTLDNNLNVNKYIDLMDRSIDKYKNLVIADHRPREYYYDL